MRLALFTLAVLLIAPAAWACVCRSVGNEPFVAPRDGQEGVARDTKIWVNPAGFGMEPGDPIVLRAGDERIAGVQTRLTARGAPREVFALLVFSPLRPLAANTLYSLEAGRARQAFRTGEGFTTGRPRLGESLTIAAGLDNTSSCGGALARLGFGSGAFLSLAMVEGTDALDPARLDGQVTSLGADGAGVLLGWGGCFARNWPEAKAGARLTVRLGAFDVAGHFSGLSSPVEVVLPGQNEATSVTLGLGEPTPRIPLEPRPLGGVSASTGCSSSGLEGLAGLWIVGPLLLRRAQRSLRGKAG